MNRRVTRDNNRPDDGGEKRPRIRGVFVVRLLVLFLLVLNLLLLYTVFRSPNGLPGYNKQNEQVQDLEEKILKLKQQNQQLFEMIQALKKDPKLLEKLVRQELGWVKEDEIILDFPQENGQGPKTSVPAKRPLPAR